MSPQCSAAIRFAAKLLAAAFLVACAVWLLFSQGNQLGIW